MNEVQCIRDLIEERNITEVVHFTSNHGVVGVIDIGCVLSRRVLPEEKHLSYIAAPTSSSRAEAEEKFDKKEDWLDYVNLSLSEINTNYFRFATRWHQNDSRWWAILSFDPEILTHEGVYFSTTNNIYPYVKRGQGCAGLTALFDGRIKRKQNWCATRYGRSERLPTCEQAEVLYPERLLIQYLNKIYVKNGDQHDIVKGWLRLYRRSDIAVDVSPEKFQGAPN